MTESGGASSHGAQGLAPAARAIPHAVALAREHGADPLHVAALVVDEQISGFVPTPPDCSRIRVARTLRTAPTATLHAPRACAPQPSRSHLSPPTRAFRAAGLPALRKGA